MFVNKYKAQLKTQDLCSKRAGSKHTNFNALDTRDDPRAPKC